MENKIVNTYLGQKGYTIPKNEISIENQKKLGTTSLLSHLLWGLQWEIINLHFQRIGSPQIKCMCRIITVLRILDHQKNTKLAKAQTLIWNFLEVSERTNM